MTIVQVKVEATDPKSLYSTKSSNKQYITKMQVENLAKQLSKPLSSGADNTFKLRVFKVKAGAQGVGIKAEVEKRHTSIKKFENAMNVAYASMPGLFQDPAVYLYQETLRQLERHCLPQLSTCIANCALSLSFNALLPQLTYNFYRDKLTIDEVKKELQTSKPPVNQVLTTMAEFVIANLGNYVAGRPFDPLISIPQTITYPVPDVIYDTILTGSANAVVKALEKTGANLLHYGQYYQRRFHGKDGNNNTLGEGHKNKVATEVVKSKLNIAKYEDFNNVIRSSIGAAVSQFVTVAINSLKHISTIEIPSMFNDNLPQIVNAARTDNPRVNVMNVLNECFATSAISLINGAFALADEAVSQASVELQNAYNIGGFSDLQKIAKLVESKSTDSRVDDMINGILESCGFFKTIRKIDRLVESEREYNQVGDVDPITGLPVAIDGLYSDLSIQGDEEDEVDLEEAIDILINMDDEEVEVGVYYDAPTYTVFADDYTDYEVHSPFGSVGYDNEILTDARGYKVAPLVSPDLMK